MKKIQVSFKFQKCMKLPESKLIKKCNFLMVSKMMREDKKAVEIKTRHRFDSLLFEGIDHSIPKVNSKDYHHPLLRKLLHRTVRACSFPQG